MSRVRDEKKNNKKPAEGANKCAGPSLTHFRVPTQDPVEITMRTSGVRIHTMYGIHFQSLGWLGLFGATINRID